MLTLKDNHKMLRRPSSEHRKYLLHCNGSNPKNMFAEKLDV